MKRSVVFAGRGAWGRTPFQSLLAGGVTTTPSDFGPRRATRDQELSLEPKISQSPSLSLTFVLTFS